MTLKEQELKLEKERQAYLLRLDSALISLPRSVLNKICNGVGAGKGTFSFIRPPQDIEQVFYLASRKHDLAYEMGGTDLHKLWADLELFSSINTCAYLFKSPIAWMHYKIWAVSCFLAVRIFGNKAFNYRERPLTSLELMQKYK